MIRVAINGFGRTGRLAFRAGLLNHSKELTFAAINTSGSMDIHGWAHLANVDTVHKRFQLEVKAEKVSPSDKPLIGYLKISRNRIPVLAQRDPSKIPWNKYKIDVVVDITGKFRSLEDASMHVKSGAKRVVIAAPPKGDGVETYILGVNKYDGKKEIISNASCTTYSLAPVMTILNSKFGIEKAVVTTVHAYTDSQKLQDGSHKDLRRARAAAMNIIPTTSGAAISTTKVIPDLENKFEGCALRVPVVAASISDVVMIMKKNVSVNKINNALEEASKKNPFKGIVITSSEPLVSSDIIGRNEPAIVDLSLTQVVVGNLVKLFVWYDNEWGYSNKLIEQVLAVGKTLY